MQYTWRFYHFPSFQSRLNSFHKIILPGNKIETTFEKEICNRHFLKQVVLFHSIILPVSTLAIIYQKKKKNFLNTIAEFKET